MWGTSFFWLHALFSMSFFVTFLPTFSLSSTPILRRKKYLCSRKQGWWWWWWCVCVCVGEGGGSTALYLTQCRAIQWKIYFNAAECFFSMRQVQPYEQLRQHIIIYDQMLNYWRFPGISSLGFLLRDLFPERKYKGNDVLSVKRTPKIKEILKNKAMIIY